MSFLRFVYLTDTHVGCDHTGYFLQPRYLDCQRRLFEGLGQWIKQHDVAFVVHGGDLTDHGSQTEINQTTEWCSLLGVPLYLCLGNHDLVQKDAMKLWRQSTLWHEGQDTCFSIDAGPATLVITNHHWHQHVNHRWLIDQPQSPRFDDRQEQALRAQFRNTSRPVIAVTHAPLNAVPICQSSREESFHPPHEPYLASWQYLAKEYPNLRLVMCGHNHAHSRHDHGSFVSCTTTAFTEAPAQIRLITVGPSLIEVNTFALAGDLGLSNDLNVDQAWCIGSPDAKTFSMPF